MCLAALLIFRVNRSTTGTPTVSAAVGFASSRPFFPTLDFERTATHRSLARMKLPRPKAFGGTKHAIYSASPR